MTRSFREPPGMWARLKKKSTAARLASCLEQAVQLLLLREVKREDGVQTVQGAAQVTEVLRPRSLRRKLCDETTEEACEPM